MSVLGPRAAEGRGPRGDRRPGPGRRAHGRRLREGRGARSLGRLLRLRRGRRGGSRAPSPVVRDGEEARPSPARAERRGIRELRGPRGSLRDDAAARASGRRYQRHLAERHGRVGDEPDGVGPRRRPEDHPRRRQRGRDRPGRHVRVGCGRPAHGGRGHLFRDAAGRRGDAERARRTPARLASRSSSARRAAGARHRVCRSSRTPARSRRTRSSATRG